MTQQELEDFKKALSHDKVIAPTLLKLVYQRRTQIDQRDDLLNDVNYLQKRAYLDGRMKDLGWFAKLLTLGDSDE